MVLYKAFLDLFSESEDKKKALKTILNISLSLSRQDLKEMYTIH